MDISYSSWAKSELGVEVDPRLEIRELEGDDERGIYVKDKSIPPQSSLARVPFTSLLTIEQLPKFPILSKVAKLLTREDDLLVLMLIHERHRGLKSKWSKHITCLPKQYHSIANYSDEDLEFIRGSNLYTIAKQWKLQIQQDYEEVMQHLTSAGLCSSPNSIFSQLTLDLYRWCLCTIWSRFISIEYRPGKILRAMVPLIDFLNHHPDVEVGHHFHTADDYLYLVTGSQQSFKTGDELFLNYGPLSNSKLLMLYGFCLLDNPFSEIELWATMTTTTPAEAGTVAAAGTVTMEEKRLFDKKQQVLNSLKIIPHRVFSPDGNPNNLLASYQFPFKAGDFVSATAAEADEEYALDVICKHDIMVFLRLQYSDIAEVARWSVLQLSALLSGRQRLSIANERKALISFQEAIQSLLQGYSSSLEDDEIVLSSLFEAKRNKEQIFVHPMNHQMHATMLVHSEKKLLKFALDKISTLLNRLEAEETFVV